MQTASMYTEVIAGITNFVSRYLSDILPRTQRWKSIQQGWEQSSSSASQTVAWVLGIAVAGLAVFIFLQQKREALKRRQRETGYFLKKAKEKDLDQKKIALLNDMVKQTGLDQPFKILDSFDSFQKTAYQYESKQSFTDQEHKYFHEQVDEIKKMLGFNKIEEVVPLESSLEIKENQEVKVSIKQGDQLYEYETVILDNSDEGLLVDCSAFKDEIRKLADNARLIFNLYRDQDAGYSFSSPVVDKSKLEKGQILAGHPPKMERTQARNFSRMDVFFPFTFYHIPFANFEPSDLDINLRKTETLPVYMGETLDISGGGMAYKTRLHVKKGDHVYLNFQMISDQHSEPVLAEVVWSGVDKNCDNDVEVVRVKYFHITEQMQDDLMRFIYQMQRKFARRLKFFRPPGQVA